MSIEDIPLTPLRDEQPEILMPSTKVSGDAALTIEGPKFDPFQSALQKSAPPTVDTGILKWYVLFFTCFLLFGTDYCYDLPGAFGAGEGVTIQTYFAEKGKSYNQKKNQALYAVYSYPNMVMPIVGGLLVDKYLGLRKSTILFCGVVVASAFIFFLGVVSSSYSLLVIARVLFGCSGENLFVAQGSYVSRWFGGSKFVAFAFGIAVSFSRLGGALVFLMSPVIADKLGAPTSAFSGFAISTLSFCSAVALVWIHHRSEQSGLVKPELAASHAHPPRKVSFSLEDPQASHSSQPTSDVNTSTSLASSLSEHDQGFHFSYLTTLPLTLLVLCISCALCYGSSFPFIEVSKTYFERVYDADSSDASSDTSMFHLFGAALCPLVGLIVDRVGRSPLWLGTSSSLLSCLFAFMLTFPGVLNAKFVMFVLSMTYAIFVAGLWSFVNLTIPSSAGGFALGVMIVANNFGLATSPLVVGAILDANTALETATPGGNAELLPSTQGFHLALFFLMSVSLVALVNAFILYLVDRANKGILMAPPASRPELKAKIDNELLAKWKKLDEAHAHEHVHK